MKLSDRGELTSKAVNKEKLDKYMGMTKQKSVEGRAKEALHVRKDKELQGCSAKDDQERKQVP